MATEQNIYTRRRRLDWIAVISAICELFSLTFRCLLKFIISVIVSGPIFSAIGITEKTAATRRIHVWVKFFVCVFYFAQRCVHAKQFCFHSFFRSLFLAGLLWIFSTSSSIKRICCWWWCCCCCSHWIRVLVSLRASHANQLEGIIIYADRIGTHSSSITNYRISSDPQREGDREGEGTREREAERESA